ncbi:2-oxoglutarate dehydrogenase, E1 component [Thiobacillus denitrificans ATCC 25259]|uniref:2-oxoglutarate dehydrogenase E1 component n=1 Tax=Thiobacillus denitrificans (strain ATCC 25259 / T1) TaxID=292415 RepID=Q3SEX2_THIDA|nr:2-oxoglutarate dehydrogenase E1 component [Thiobacillus denitrificans]AAZ97141.1 2-oxoglutarate dehydrogenase, E1 component [Thiobacillus denitrificans ATCC 25259]
MSAPDWLSTSPLYSGNAAYLEQFGDAALAAWLGRPVSAATDESDAAQVAVLRLINAYRYLGVRQAALDPLRRFEPPSTPELDPAHYGLTDADLTREFDTGSLFGVERTTLDDILQRLRSAYCGHVGVEYMHITEVTRKRWLQERIESAQGRFGVTAAQKKRLLKRLTDAETLEKFLHTRHVGQKRFSLEGGESLIPLLDHVIARCARHGAKEIVMGMAHRGRINVLVNIMGRTVDSLYDEPQDGHPETPLSGDVKYHQGFSTDMGTDYGPVHLALAFNPSHLEIVHPVVRGSVRARQDRRGDVLGYEVVPVILHGDAALSGQGVVMESLNMSQTRGFRNGGAIHVVINNQIGFTTSDPRDVRSTLYCTDVAKMVEAPVLHVNGDDPEAVAFAVQTAVDYRYTFHKNVFIDLVCYRRHGHNEQDEPLATQPLMYRRVQAHPSTRTLYAQRLVDEGVLTQAEADDLVDVCRERLEHGRPLSAPALSDFKETFATDWSRFRGDAGAATPGISATRLDFLGERITTLEHEIELHPRVQKVLDDRRRMRAGELAVDWGYAENLAYASLLDVGYNVRVSGQDSARGTFFHRHAVWHDQKRERRQSGVYVPLEHIHARQGNFTIIDSLLSEEAVLAFEYGYSTADPDTLVVWEAQFGDFANGAQVVIDQFITSGEAKWGRLCGLTLMLPHGFEGQGPEHSSARLERFLQLCAQENIQVCVPTLPAQMFHLLRRQLLRPLRKPLVVLSPKSLLRHPASTSSLADLSDGAFLPVIDDPRQPREARRVVVCSGRVWFDLEAARAARGLDDVALVRIEQLYPFPDAEFGAVLDVYPLAGTLVWAQEEPMNQGAWYQTLHHLNRCAPAGRRFHYAGRPAAAAPASGYISRHRAELEALLRDALETSYEV